MYSHQKPHYNVGGVSDNVRFLFSPLIAKPTTAVLTLLYLTILFKGECMLYVLFETSAILSPVTMNSFTAFGTLISDNLMDFSVTLGETLSLIIIVSTAPAMEYLYNLTFKLSCIGIPLPVPCLLE